jgi:hypothetical protein
MGFIVSGETHHYTLIWLTIHDYKNIKLHQKYMFSPELRQNSLTCIPETVYRWSAGSAAFFSVPDVADFFNGALPLSEIADGVFASPELFLYSVRLYCMT